MVKTSNVENLSQPLFKKERGIHYEIDFMCEIEVALKFCSDKGIYVRTV